MVILIILTTYRGAAGVPPLIEHNVAIPHAQSQTSKRSCIPRQKNIKKAQEKGLQYM